MYCMVDGLMFLCVDNFIMRCLVCCEMVWVRCRCVEVGLLFGRIKDCSGVRFVFSVLIVCLMVLICGFVICNGL